MNNINATGRLGKDPEAKYTTNANLMVTFSLGVDRWSNGNKETDWFNCVAFKKTAEMITKHCKKGDMIGITGQMQSRVVEKEDGTKTTYWSVLINELTLLNPKKTETTSEQTTDAVIEEVKNALPFEI